MGKTDETVRRTARVLTGFLSANEAAAFAGRACDPSAFMAAWQAQQTALPPLTPEVPQPRIADIEPTMLAHVVEVRASPVYAGFYGSAEIRLVELRKLLAFQAWMDTDVSSGVHGEGVNGAPSEQKLLDACLPKSIVSPAQTSAMMLPNGIVIYSPDNTFRARGPQVDFATGEVKYVLSPNANLMMVKEHQGRLVLANGYHRAWWLRSQGVEMVPAVIMPIADRADLAPPGSISADLLMSDRPPTIDDFFNDDLSISVEVRAMLTQVRITAEMLPVPRLL